MSNAPLSLIQSPNHLALQRASYFQDPESNFSSFQVTILEAEDSLENLQHFLNFQKTLKAAKNINPTMRFKKGKILVKIQRDKKLSSSKLQDWASENLDISGKTALNYIKYYLRIMELAEACNSHGLEDLVDPSERDCIKLLLTFKIGGILESSPKADDVVEEETATEADPPAPIADLQPKLDELEKANAAALAKVRKLEAELESEPEPVTEDDEDPDDLGEVQNELHPSLETKDECIEWFEEQTASALDHLKRIPVQHRGGCVKALLTILKTTLPIPKKKAT